MGVKRWLPVLLLLLVLIPQSGWSAAAGPRCSWMTEDQPAGSGACSAYKGITNKAVKCISISLMDASATILPQIRTIAWPIAQAIILFGFALMGYRLMLGGLGQNAKGELLMFVIKGALVVYFMFNMEMWFARAVCVSGDVLDALTGVLKSQTMVQMMCIRGGDLDSYNVWNYMDCFIGSLLMLDPENSSPIPGAGPGNPLMLIPLGIVMFGAMVGSAFSGPLGTYLMFTGIAAIFTLVFSFFRAAYAFLTALIAVMILVVVSLFILPLIMLGKFGDGNSIPGALFNGWLRALMANLMLPVVVVAFITFSIIAIDYFFFSAPKSLMESVFLKSADTVSNDDIEAFRHGFLQDTKINLGSMFIPDSLVPNTTERPTTSTSSIVQTLAAPFGPVEVNSPSLPALNIRQHPTLRTAAADCLKNDLCAKELQNAFMEGLLSAFATMMVLSALIFTLMESLPQLGLKLIGDIGRAAPIDAMPFANQRGDGTFMPNIYGNVLRERDQALQRTTINPMTGQAYDLQTIRPGTSADLMQPLENLPNTMMRGSIFEGMFPRNNGGGSGSS